MTALFMLALVVIVAAALVDRVVAGASLDEWRRSSRDLVNRMNRRGESDLTAQAHALFCNFFDRIYGARTWSKRRLWASLLSSGLGLVVVVFVIGPSRTILWTLFVNPAEPGSIGKERAIAAMLIVGVVATILNLVPDFFSLMETRLVLRWARGRGPLGLLVLTVLDLILTTAIFGLMLFGIWRLILWDGIPMDTYEQGTYVRFVAGVGGLLPFFLTTFITSLLWMLFVACFWAIRILSLHPLTRFIVHGMSQSERPTVAFSSLAIMLIALFWLPASLLFGTTIAGELPRSWTRASARMIELDRTYTGHFSSQSQYWVRFQGQAGQMYRIETKIPTNSSADTVLQLYGPDSGHIKVDDDSGRKLNSLIKFNCDSTGVFAVRILTFGFVLPGADFKFQITAGDPRGEKPE